MRGLSRGPWCRRSELTSFFARGQRAFKLVLKLSKEEEEKGRERERERKRKKKEKNEESGRTVKAGRAG